MNSCHTSNKKNDSRLRDGPGWNKTDKEQATEINRSAFMAARFRNLPKAGVRGLSPKAFDKNERAKDTKVFCSLRV
jgi:hypothetical protein